MYIKELYIQTTMLREYVIKELYKHIYIQEIHRQIPMTVKYIIKELWILTQRSYAQKTNLIFP